MTEASYELETAAPARKALTDQLPHDVAVAAVEFVTGPLLENPHRVGAALTQEVTGIYSARLARNWSALYEVDEDKRMVRVFAIRHRANAYRFR